MKAREIEEVSRVIALHLLEMEIIQSHQLSRVSFEVEKLLKGHRVLIKCPYCGYEGEGL